MVVSPLEQAIRSVLETEPYEDAVTFPCVRCGNQVERESDEYCRACVEDPGEYQDDGEDL
jgi:hypothetical protein